MYDEPTRRTPRSRRGGEITGETGRRPLSARVVLAALVAAALIIFVVQNDERVPVSWLFLSMEGPLWSVIIVAAVAGAVLTEVVGWFVRRARRRRHMDRRHMDQRRPRR